MKKLLLAALLSAAPARGASAQQAEAARLTASPRLDGRLTEEIWRTAPPVTGLVQREPTEGAPAIENTEVRFAYDEDALWIGARMFSNSPKDIRALVTRRDREGSSEQIVISLDTHHDRRTAYTFSATPAGVRIDWYHGSDNENSRDYGWNAVWEVETNIDSLGWTAEIRIPFTQLRFNPGDEQTWGVNVVRRVPARNEESYWMLVKRAETGWSSRMGTLTGIRGIRPSRRIEILPYIAADSRLRDEVDPDNPFVKKTDLGTRVGADLKMGIGPNLTLDVTLNPDFGQVEADPAEVNLTAYETFFAERRPFFLEGAQLFGGRGLFYSRRIGAPPPGFANADYVEPIDNTTILGAAKLTGRMPSGLSVGALAAVTDREVVRTFDTDTRRYGNSVVAPRTAYAVASLQQEFGRTRSTFGGTLTAVQRDLDGVPALEQLLPRDAYSGILDTRIRWAGGKYDMSAYAGYTTVHGDSSAMLRLQTSPSRLWQRPDASHVDLDSSRTGMSGGMLGINHSKLAGAHWRWDIDYWEEQPGLEANDIGAFGAVDDRSVNGNIRYRESVPAKWYRFYEIGVGGEGNWNFERMRRAANAFTFASITWPNFWRTGFDYVVITPGLSDRLTRGGPVMATPSAWLTVLSLENPAGARTGWSVEVSARDDAIGGWRRDIEMSLSLRPGPQWEISVGPSLAREEVSQQFVTSFASGRGETFGRRYVFAHVDRSEVSTQLRLNYTFTPNLTLETYVEPFASSGTYHSFGELRTPRDYDLIEYGTEGTTITRNSDGSRTVTADAQSYTIPNRDFNVRSLRSNLVMRWEWRPGSTLYLVWQQDRGASRDPARVQPADLFDAFRSKGDNFLAMKVSYWIPLR